MLAGAFLNPLWIVVDLAHFGVASAGGLAQTNEVVMVDHRWRGSPTAMSVEGHDGPEPGKWQAANSVTAE